jgi:penicillin amidase
MRKLKIAGIAVAVLAVALYASFQIFFRTAVPSYEGTVTIDGLGSKVEVRTDEHGIPHIFAGNDHDLFFAQGYVTARERMFQMEITRLAGRGELSSLFGEATIEKDKFLKTVGIHRLAKIGYRAMSAETRAIIDAYTAGVNAYIRDAKTLPREFAILGAKPGTWESEDCVSTVLLMAFSLTRSFMIDLVLYRVGEHAGAETAEALAPSYPDFAPTLTGKRMSPVPLGVLKSRFHKFESTAAGAFMHGPLVMELPASNWMIFSGKRTKSGKAIFAGSPDLKPTLPALFYLMRLKGGSFDVAGGAMPGMPGIGPLGFNGNIAWSAVNGRGDELDYYVEKPDPNDANRYLAPGGPRAYTVIEETLRIKTKKGVREEKYPVKISRHGPIISPVMPMAPANCAMKWAAFENPSTDLEGLLGLNRARDFTGFRKALSRVKNNNLGIGYADREGNIGWQFTASAPVRRTGDGTFPVPGWVDDYEWTGYVPYERLPYDYNPPAGWIASFNNDPGNAPYHLTNYYLFERSVRFADIMAERKDAPVDVDQVMAMQLDTVSVVAKRWTPIVLEACREPEFKKYTALFRGWKYSVDIDGTAGTLFNAFYANFLKNVLSDEIGEKLWKEGLGQSYLYYVADLALARIALTPDHAFYDDVRTADLKESRDDIIRKSMRETIAQLRDLLGGNPDTWRWGRAHRMYFEHPLGAKLSFFNLKPIPTNGEHHTINSGFWETANPFKMDSGGVIRMMVDFAQPEKATIISPPGQSGAYKSPHYDDLARLWADGKQVPMRFFTAKDIARMMTLEPKTK